MTKPYNKYSFGKHEVVEKKREKSGKKTFILFLFVFCLACFFSILFLRSSFFAIEKINIGGLSELPEEEVISVMEINRGTSIWEVSPPELEKRIMSIPSVKSARVERTPPGSINVHIEEKAAKALVPHQHYYLELSASGSFIGIQQQITGDLPLVNGLTWGRMDVGEKIPDPVKKEILVDVLEEISSLERPVISEINIENPDQIMLYTMDGLEVLLGQKDEIRRKIDVLSKIYLKLDQELMGSGYLDLRVTEAPVFKPFPEQKNN